VNFENYKYFIAAAEDLNFTQAAKKLFLSQQALSKQIDKMEKAYHVKLFNREPPMSLTPAGECLYRHICRLMDDERQMRRELDSLMKAGSSRLTIGVSPIRGSVLLPRVLAAFYKEHPETMIHIEESNLSKILEMLKLGKVELIFGYEQMADEDLVCKPLLEEKVVFVLPRALAPRYFAPDKLQRMREAGIASLGDFAGCPFLRFRGFTWLGTHYDRCRELEREEPKVILESGNVFTILDCCLEGLGAALVPDLYVKKLPKEQRATLLQFQWDYQAARSNSAILYSKRSYMTETAMEFIRTAQRVYEAGIEGIGALHPPQQAPRIVQDE